VEKWEEHNLLRLFRDQFEFDFWFQSKSESAFKVTLSHFYLLLLQNIHVSPAFRYFDTTLKSKIDVKVIGVRSVLMKMKLVEVLAKSRFP
jgi:hypothetical protein